MEQVLRQSRARPGNAVFYHGRSGVPASHRGPYAGHGHGARDRPRLAGLVHWRLGRDDGRDAMTSTRGEGNRAAAVTPHAEGDAAFRAGLVIVLAEHDDPLLAAHLADDLELLNHNR
jgi:hypothetical protein